VQREEALINFTKFAQKEGKRIMKDFKGVFSALVTPLTPAGEVNYSVLRRLVDHQLSKGIDGFYVCGSTAEVFMLDEKERKRIVETVIEQNNGRGVIVVHVGSIGTRLTIDYARHAKQAGADAVSAVTPFYYQFSSQEIIRYYADLAEASDLPTIVYNFPSLTGYSLTIDEVDRLAEFKNIIGIKYTSLDLFKLERFKQKHPELIIYNGHDEVLAYGLMAGADGGIGSTYNIMPEIYRAILDSFRKGDFKAMQELQHKANNVISVAAKYGATQVVKAILDLQGFECGNCRGPFMPLTDAAKEEIRLCYENFLKE